MPTGKQCPSSKSAGSWTSMFRRNVLFLLQGASFVHAITSVVVERDMLRRLLSARLTTRGAQAPRSEESPALTRRFGCGTADEAQPEKPKTG